MQKLLSQFENQPIYHVNICRYTESHLLLVWSVAVNMVTMYSQHLRYLFVCLSKCDVMCTCYDPYLDVPYIEPFWLPLAHLRVHEKESTALATAWPIQNPKCVQKAWWSIVTTSLFSQNCCRDPSFTTHLLDSALPILLHPHTPTSLFHSLTLGFEHLVINFSTSTEERAKLARTAASQWVSRHQHLKGVWRFSVMTNWQHEGWLEFACLHQLEVTA